ncbi:MAG: DUF2797 domain-containing protein [Bdellovibrionota bacterium]
MGELKGPIRKMRTHYKLGFPVSYELPIANELLPLNNLLEKKILLDFGGEISCTYCGRSIKKSFAQGYCFPCFQSLPQTDLCIVKPELCHYDKGTCRDPAWGREHCFVDHTVYFANSSGLKVGITRSHQQLTRWMDQGAIQALPIARVKRRLEAGKVEVALKQRISDKTNWRKMLKGDVEPLDLKSFASDLLHYIPENLEVEKLDEDIVEIEYPVLKPLDKIKSFNLDKNPKVEGILLGIKGQYLLLDTGVINMRKYAGYVLSIISDF